MPCSIKRVISPRKMKHSTTVSNDCIKTTEESLNIPQKQRSVTTRHRDSKINGNKQFTPNKVNMSVSFLNEKFVFA